jgi:hypothetical protein
MKIAFDENVPLGMVRTFEVLSKERQLRRTVGTQLSVQSAKDYAPRPNDLDHLKGSDVPWLKRFSVNGGRGVISGDVSMRSNPHELGALIQLGLVVIFFERKWSEWDFFKKTALLMYYWPKMAKKLKNAKAGEFWCVPGHWRDDGELRDVSPSSARTLSKKSPIPHVKRKTAASKTRTKSRVGKSMVTSKGPPKKRSSVDERQGRLKLDSNE